MKVTLIQKGLRLRSLDKHYRPMLLESNPDSEGIKTWNRVGEELLATLESNPDSEGIKTG